jgi:hypothetical protein
MRMLNFFDGKKSNFQCVSLLGKKKVIKSKVKKKRRSSILHKTQIPAIEEVQQWDSQIFNGMRRIERDEMTGDKITRSLFEKRHWLVVTAKGQSIENYYFFLLSNMEIK